MNGRFSSVEVEAGGGGAVRIRTSAGISLSAGLDYNHSRNTQSLNPFNQSISQSVQMTNVTDKDAIAVQIKAFNTII